MEHITLDELTAIVQQAREDAEPYARRAPGAFEAEFTASLHRQINAKLEAKANEQ